MNAKILGEHREELWKKVFLAAVTGTCGDHNVENAGAVVDFAMRVADSALEKLDIKPITPAKSR